MEINLEKVKKLYDYIKSNKADEDAVVTPIGFIDKDKLDNKQEYEAIGAEVFKNDQFAVVTMAGGQGTRLGFDGPKGTYKLDIGNDGKYIFQILTENLFKAKELYGTLPYWYIMTSEDNDSDTQKFFKEHNYFDYEEDKIKFFKQGVLPLLTPEGETVEEDGKIITAADGNGGIYSSLKNSGMLDDMKSHDVKWVYTCGVDNIMVNPIDSLFLGLTISKNVQIASKSIVKSCPEEKVGVFCRKNGKPSVVEYIELTDEMRNLRSDDGELVYGEGTFMNNLYTIDAMDKIADLELPYHIAVKRGLYKFETFIFDAFPYFDDMLIFRVNRNEEFAPIKNKEGVDSPETAIKIYLENHNK